MEMRDTTKTRERRTAGRGKLSVFRDLLYRVLRFIARHVSGFFAAIALFFTAGVAIFLVAAIAFTAIAGVVSVGVTQSFDDSVLAWFARHRTPWLDHIMLQVTALGNGTVLIVLVLVASVFLWQTQHKWSVYLLFLGVFGGQILSAILKDSFERPRPSIVEAVTRVTSMSFPSGHAMTSVIVYGAVGHLVARLEPTAGLRRTTWTFAILMILLIGISRMYLGVHYPSDVLAGFVAGLAWLSFVAAGISAVRLFAHRRPETLAEDKDLHAEDERLVGIRE
jgi:undecaprenyl-diphosphatase